MLQQGWHTPARLSFHETSCHASVMMTGAKNPWGGITTNTNTSSSTPVKLTQWSQLSLSTKRWYLQEPGALEMGFCDWTLRIDFKQQCPYGWEPMLDPPAWVHIREGLGLLTVSENCMVHLFLPPRSSLNHSKTFMGECKNTI